MFLNLAGDNSKLKLEGYINNNFVFILVLRHITKKINANYFVDAIPIGVGYQAGYALVKSALSKRFKILKTTLMNEGKDVLFVCRKK